MQIWAIHMLDATSEASNRAIHQKMLVDSDVREPCFAQTPEADNAHAWMHPFAHEPETHRDDEGILVRFTYHNGANFLFQLRAQPLVRVKLQYPGRLNGEPLNRPVPLIAVVGELTLDDLHSMVNRHIHGLVRAETVDDEHLRCPLSNALKRSGEILLFVQGEDYDGDGQSLLLRLRCRHVTSSSGFRAITTTSSPRPIAS